MTTGGLLATALVWVVWIGALSIVAVSLGLSLVGFGVFGPIALIHRARYGRWPRWSARLFAYASAAGLLAVPAALFLLNAMNA
jgi:ABC-type nickel/cobalt efflux system permease component RcnA